MSDPARKAEKAEVRQQREERYNTAVLDHAQHGIEFLPFPKIPRLNRDITITEKIDGTNGAIHVEARNVEALSFGSTDVDDLGRVVAQSRTRLLTREEDNFGFAKWVEENEQPLREVLGPGIHFGEWWGEGIQRGYGQRRKWFSLFNYNRWANDPNVASLASIGVQVVPILYHGPWMAVVAGTPGAIYPTRNEDGSLSPGILRFAPDLMIEWLRDRGSHAAPGWKKDEKTGAKGPEGIVVFHEAGRLLFKATIERDEAPKTQAQEAHEKWLDEIEKEPI